MKRLSTLLALGATLATPAQATADEPPVRRIDSAEVVRDGGPDGSRLLIIRGEGLAGISGISIGDTDVPVFIPMSQEVRAILPDVPEGQYRVRLRWGRFVSEPKQLCSPSPVLVREPGCVLKAVQFETGLHKLDAEALATTNANARCILDSGQKRILLLGFESQSGNSPKLAQSRADNVKSALSAALGSNAIDIQTDGLWKWLPAKLGTADVESQRVLFAVPGYPDFKAPRLELEANLDFQTKAKEQLLETLRSFQMNGVTAVLLVFPRTVNGQKAQEPTLAQESMSKALEEAARMAGMPNEPLKVFVAFGDPPNKQLADNLSGRAAPSTETPKAGSRAAYLYPLQWIPGAKNATTAPTNPDPTCPSEAKAPPPSPPVAPTCPPCKPAVTVPPNVPAKWPRGFVHARFGGLKMGARGFFGGALRSGAFLGEGDNQWIVAMDVASHYANDGSPLSGGSQVPLLIMPSLVFGRTWTWPKVRTSLSFLGGPLLPTWNGFALDSEFSLGWRITPTFEMFAQPGIGLGISPTNGAELRLQFGIGTMIGFP
ncbi:hypothetical protein [Polyangium sorediatum]|uniref:OmpA-like domain-containing protein n=1 Tax=Polyangium sorediatum TaxID=889274 RepID=A0ABT6NSH4_9BACT|nr:hypothetical protein [Polyangium sorediatum]MDI1431105.1 hypothetical protein [Polyangium sorediatum]